MAQPEQPGNVHRSWRRRLLPALLVGAGLTLLRRLRRPSRPGHQRLPGVDPEDLAAGHETSDANLRAILAVAAGLVVVLGLAFIAVTVLETPYREEPLALNALPGLTPQPTLQPLPSPQLEAEPGQQLREYRARQQQILHSYAWVDRSSGVARIPIERSMALLLQQGLPTRPPTEAQQFRDHGDSLPSDSSSGRAEQRIWP